MGNRDRHLPAALVATADVLRRARPQMTDEEIARLDRRVRCRAPERRMPSLAVAFCLALGLVLMTAGTGLALSGVTSAPESGSRGANGVGATTARGDRTAARPDHASRPGVPPPVSGRGERTDSGAPSLGDSGRTRPSADPFGVTRAASRMDAPFTGVAAIALLLAGLGLLATAATAARRPAHMS